MAKIELLNQVKNFYNKLSKMQKIIIGSAVGIALVGSLVLAFSTSKKEDKGVLFTDLDQKDAAKIVEVLKDKKVEYELKDDGKTILVNKDKVYDTRLTVASQGLPEQGGVGYEIFDKANLGMSEFVQKLNYRRALEGELARTIGSLDEVKTARVHLVIPEKALFEKDQKQPSAAVTLHFKTGRSLSNISVEGIQHLVASSIEGMLPGAVTVVDSRGKVLSSDPLDDKTPAGMTAQQYDQQRKVDQYLTDKVQSLLDATIGSGNSEVRINTDLDFTQIEKNITDFDPERQVVRSEQRIEDKTKSSDSLSYPAVNMDKNQTNQIANYEISKSVQKIVEGVGGIKRMSVAVFINGTQKVVDQNGMKVLQYTPRTPQEIQNFTQIVKNAVGFDSSRNDQISVVNVPFESMMDEPDLQKLNPIPWYKQPEYIKLIALIVAMLFTIFLIYKILQSKAIKNKFRIAFELPEKVKLAAEEEEPEEEEEELEEIEFDDDDLLLLPAELPEQLLLEGDRLEPEVEEYEEEADEFDQNDLATSANASLEEGSGELSEEALMKIELKNKVENYVEDQPQEAVKLVRMLLAQDFDEKNLKL